MNLEQRLEKLSAVVGTPGYRAGDFPSVQHRLATLWREAIEAGDGSLARRFAAVYLEGFRKVGFDVSSNVLRSVIRSLLERGERLEDYHLQEGGELQRALEAEVDPL